ncbi:MAG: hypothetical protein HGA19_13195 [Oscillochloris sp.]|nr:hypothetical protein [Oscillochloris sp.]
MPGPSTGGLCLRRPLKRAAEPAFAGVVIRSRGLQAPAGGCPKPYAALTGGCLLPAF